MAVLQFQSSSSVEQTAGVMIPSGHPLAIVARSVDDVVTTAGSTLKAIEAAEAGGHTVVAMICLVDREEGGAAKLAAYPFHALFKRTEIFG
jgi:orotate phosphoribosyltransferase